MRKIGGINMAYVVNLGGNKIKLKRLQRSCSIYEALEQSLKEVKLMKEGKLKLKTWDELYQELKERKE